MILSKPGKSNLRVVVLSAVLSDGMKTVFVRFVVLVAILGNSLIALSVWNWEKTDQALESVTDLVQDSFFDLLNQSNTELVNVADIRSARSRKMQPSKTATLYSYFYRTSHVGCATV